jgi:hypothetical protein
MRYPRCIVAIATTAVVAVPLMVPGRVAAAPPSPAVPRDQPAPPPICRYLLGRPRPQPWPARRATTETTTLAPIACDASAGATLQPKAALAITGVFPTLLRPGLPTTVMIEGSGFTASARVAVSGSPIVHVVQTKFVDSAHLVALLNADPEGPIGDGDLAVTVPGLGTANRPNAVYISEGPPVPAGQPFVFGTARGVIRPGSTGVVEYFGFDIPPTGALVRVDQGAPAGVTVQSVAVSKTGDDVRVTLRASNSAALGIHDLVVVNPKTGRSDAAPGGFVVRRPGGEFRTVAPRRLLDTRLLGGPLGPGGTGMLQLPPDVASGMAVVLNVTATNPTAGSFLTLFPAGTSRPGVSSLDFAPGQTIANVVTVAPGSGGRVSLFNFAGTVDVVVDLVGVYDSDTSGPGGGVFTSAGGPNVVFDTRYELPLLPRETRQVEIPVDIGPSLPGPVVLNVTVTDPSEAGYLTVWPSGQPRPATSNLDFAPGETIANQVIVNPGRDGLVNVFNSAGATHVVFAVLGSYDDGTPPNPGGQFRLITPSRFVDTRLSGGPLAPGGGRVVTLAGRGGVPVVSRTAPISPPPGFGPTPEGGAVVANVTITEPTEATYVTLADPEINAIENIFPNASSLNAPAGASVANAMPIGLDAAGRAFLGNYAGHTHLTIDVTGYFT